MMKQSAGILVYRLNKNSVEVLLVHPGGPFWIKKDAAAWSIPKGEFSEDENPMDAAIREFKEETGKEISGDFISLNPLKQKSGKIIYAWMVNADFNAEEIKSNMFEIEWPPKSGMKKQFPEVDKARWFELSIAKEKIHNGQIGFIEQLILKIKTNSDR